MTTWIESPRGGRERGPRGLVRAWVEVLVRPRRFFSNGVAPGDQAPGLAFGIAVALAYVGGLWTFSPGARPDFGGPTVSLVLGTLLVALLIAPAVLHLLAAVQTVLLIPLVSDRTGVSETVQTVAYATAPCALAGLPWPALRLACALYGAALLIVGLRTVHGTTFARAAAAGAVPAALLFGWGFRGSGAAVAVASAL